MFDKTWVLLWYLVGSCVSKDVEICEGIEGMSMKGPMEIEQSSSLISIKLI
jgi:hypothetical protein